MKQMLNKVNILLKQAEVEQPKEDWFTRRSTVEWGVISLGIIVIGMVLQSIYNKLQEKKNDQVTKILKIFRRNMNDNIEMTSAQSAIPVKPPRTASDNTNEVEEHEYITML